MNGENKLMTTRGGAEIVEYVQPLDATPPQPPKPANPLLVVHGSAGVGSFRARGPHHSELRRLARGR